MLNDCTRSTTQSIAILLLILSALGAGCQRLPGRLRTPMPTPARATLPVPVGDDISLTGVVLENDHSCEVDGTCQLEVDTGSGVVTVIYHYGEGEICKNESVFDRAWQLQGRDRVEVSAEVTGNSVISVCNATRYEIQKLP